MIFILAVLGEALFAALQPAVKEFITIIPTARLLAEIAPNSSHISELRRRGRRGCL